MSSSFRRDSSSATVALSIASNPSGSAATIWALISSPPVPSIFTATCRSSAALVLGLDSDTTVQHNKHDATRWKNRRDRQDWRDQRELVDSAVKRGSCRMDSLITRVSL